MHIDNIDQTKPILIMPNVYELIKFVIKSGHIYNVANSNRQEEQQQQ